MQIGRVAAEFMNEQRETLVEVLAKYVMATEPDLTELGGLTDSPKKIQQLYREINNYIDWLCHSLNNGEPVNGIEMTLTLPSNFYAAAFDFIKQEWVLKHLSPDVAEELKIYLDYLINHLYHSS
jgi:hypothetical protein